MKWIRFAVPLAILGAVIFIFGGLIRAADANFPIYFPNSKVVVKAETFNKVTYLPLKEIIEHMGLPYHQAGIRPVELPRPSRADQGFFSRSSGSRSFLRYGYGDLLAEDRRFDVVHRMWPGTQRMLLWGDPLFASAYGRTSSF